MNFIGFYILGMLAPVSRFLSGNVEQGQYTRYTAFSSHITYSKSTAEIMPPSPWFLIISYSFVLAQFSAQLPFLCSSSMWSLVAE